MLCPYCDYYEYYLIFEANAIYDNRFLFVEINDQFTSKNTEHICLECCCQISSGELYIHENTINFAEYICDKLASFVMSKIECCEECSVGEEINYMQQQYEKLMGDDYNAYYSPIPDTSQYIWDLISDVTFECDNISSDILNLCSCPICDNGSGANYSLKRDCGKFTDLTNVYTKNDIDRFHELFYGELSQVKFGIDDLASHASLEEIQALEQEIINHGRYHTYSLDTFNQIHRFLEIVFEQKLYYEVTVGRTIYHLRNNEIGKPPFTADEMWTAPYEVVNHGRYNDIGEPILYASNNPKILSLEVPPRADQIPNIAIMLVNKTLQLFPVDRFFRGAYGTLVSKPVEDKDKSKSYKRQYIITNIIAAIAKKVGFDGTAYISTKDNLSTNYALFNSQAEEKLSIITVRS